MKIAILGTAAHCLKAPFSDPTWQIWGCNTGALERWDRWFQLHDDATMDSHEGHRAWLVEAAKEKLVYTQTGFDGTTRYPLLEMTAKYGTWFFSSTIAFMLAMALEEKPDELGLWGVDMADHTEYVHQKPGCRFFLQLARLNGIKVTVPEEAEIITAGKLYCYDTSQSWLGMKVAARKAELVGRQQDLMRQKEALVLQKAALHGAMNITVPLAQIPAMVKNVDTAIAQVERDIILFEGGIQDMTHIETNWV